MRFHFSEIIFIVGFVAYVVIRGVFEQRAKASSIVVKRVNTGETALLIVMALGGMVVPVVYLLTPFLAFADYRLPQLMPYAGTAILLCSLWLFWRAHADLGENWSRTLEMRQDHKLVTRGVYRSIRHPMYAAIWLFSLAQGLLLQNWFAGWSAIVAFAVMYFVRLGNEERMMTEHFGEEYKQYVSKTGRLFPRIKR